MIYTIRILRQAQDEWVGKYKCARGELVEPYKQILLTGLI